MHSITPAAQTYEHLRVGRLIKSHLWVLHQISISGITLCRPIKVAHQLRWSQAACHNRITIFNRYLGYSLATSHQANTSPTIMVSCRARCETSVIVALIRIAKPHNTIQNSTRWDKIPVLTDQVHSQGVYPKVKLKLSTPRWPQVFSHQSQDTVSLMLSQPNTLRIIASNFME